MREEQRDVEPGNKVEKENSRNERVLGGDEIKHEHPDAGERLPKTEAMLPEQFVLQKIITRAAAGERFQEHPKNEQATVNAVTSPGKLGTGRIKSHHDPDAEPEKCGHHHDLAEEEKAVETFRALRNHGYCAARGLRVRDGGQPSTRAKVGANMGIPFGKRDARFI